MIEETLSAVSNEGFERRIGLFSAITINMSQMVGVGPFLTIPLMLTAMGGPQAIIGWLVGSVLAVADGLVWSELGTALPSSGGPYTFLKEAYGRWTGNLTPFLFVWSMVLATPLLMSTGMIGMAQYLAQPLSTLWPGHTLLLTRGLAVGATGLTVALLYRRIALVATITKVLWAGMLLTVGLVLLAALTHFDTHQVLAVPAGALTPTPAFFTGMGSALILAMYNFMGYQTVAHLGDEVKNPARVLPRAIILSIAGVAVIDLALQIAVTGVLPWREAAASPAVAALLLTRVWGPWAGGLITVLIAWTAFASVFTGILGASRLPYNAARDGLFLPIFGRLHPTLGFPHMALLGMAGLTAVACLFDLATVINALTALFILVQFIGQIGALVVLRITRPAMPRPFRQWLYPLPCVVALCGWLAVFWATGWAAICLALLWLGVGSLVYLWRLRPRPT